MGSRGKLAHLFYDKTMRAQSSSTNIYLLHYIILLITQVAIKHIKCKDS